MKVAFLFTGQFRQINKDLFRKSFSTLVSDIDYSIFSYCWDESSESLNHSNLIPELINLKDVSQRVEKLFEGFNFENHNSESFIEFKKQLKPNIANIISSKEFHKGTINSLPQIYTIHKCFKLLGDSIDSFDLIFRCRYDSLFLHPIKNYPLEEIFKSDHLYNINFGRAYYPKRVYDIFFGGSIKGMSFLDTIWNDIPHLIQDDFDNGLDKRDCCRLLYLSATKKMTKVYSLKTRICDIYRMEKSFNYEKYLIKSHLFSMKPSRAAIFSIKYFKNWLSLRGLPINQIFKLFFIAILLLPFSYIKRVKYIKQIIKLN